MAIRIRKVDGITVALCAAATEPAEGDIYLDDSAHEALSDKFAVDFKHMGWCYDIQCDKQREKIMWREEASFGYITGIPLYY